jgi:DNA-binding NarL/FixJ family response regulator
VTGASTRRVLVVDDHPMFRAGLVAVVDDLPWAEVVAEAGDGEEALVRARELRPDIVLMDLQMPVRNGLEATRVLSEELPETAVLVMTMVENDDAVTAALRAGARGYLVKGASRGQIVRALEAVADGEVILGAGVGRGVLGRLTASQDGLRPFPELSEREREVLDLMARGLDNRAVAQQLFLSEKTIRNIVSAVLAKTGAGTRAAAIAAARDAGLGVRPLR